MKKYVILLAILIIMTLGSSFVLADPYALPDPEIKIIIYKG